MTDDRNAAAGDADFEDPNLQNLADAILEGTPVDWARTPGNADPALLEQLHVLAAFADVHRTPGRHDPNALNTTSPLGTWGPLTLLERIGRGAFGEVYRAWDTRLDREVALKLLHQSEDDPSQQPRRSIQEGRLLARIRHPNVVTVYGAERIDGQIGIWTEFVHGETLAARQQERGPFPVAEAIAIGIDLCRALAAAHAVALLHRDIKTQNVMREPSGRIVLVDFGASEDSPNPGTIVATKPLTGTPLYMAPELWTGGTPGVQTDIYSLGVLLYHIVTGSYPVQGASIDDIRNAHQTVGRTLLSGTGTELPRSFVTTVDRAIDPNPSRRFETASALEAALAECLELGNRAAAFVDSRTTRQRQRARRVSLTLAATLLVAVIGPVLLFTGNQDDARPPVPPPQPTQARSAPLRAEPLAPDPISDTAVAVGGAEQTAPTDGGQQPPLTVRASSVEPPEPTFRSIRMVDGPAKVGHASRDGRYVPYVDANGDLVVWETPTGRRTVVANQDTGPGPFFLPLMSPEGDRIAFQRQLSDNDRQLRIINADGSAPRVLLKSELAPLPIEWSKDGRQILCWLRKNNNVYWDLTLVPVDGGPPRIVRHFDGEPPVGASLSGDGRFVVYDLQADGPRSPRDLFIVGTDGSPPRVLLPGPASRPLWTPDDGYIFFQSIRSGSMAGWIVPVADGVATGHPHMVARDVSAPTDWSMTEDGAVYYPVEDFFSEDRSVAFDPSATVESKQPVPFSTKVQGTHSGFSWSPDGESIAYVVRPYRVGFQPSDHPPLLSILDRGSKVPRTFALEGLSVGDVPPRWAPNGESVVVWAKNADDRWGYFRLDARTGASVPLFLVDTYRRGLFEWSPTGTTLFFFDPARGILGRELTSGAETIAASNEAWPSGPSGVAIGMVSFLVSPDGLSIAFTARDQNGKMALVLQRIGGTARELVNVSPSHWLDVHGWTREPDAVIYSELADNQRQLWRAPVDGGPPQRLVTPAGLPTSRLAYISISPDGRKLGYTDVASVLNLWILERFLPAAR